MFDICGERLISASIWYLKRQSSSARDMSSVSSTARTPQISRSQDSAQVKPISIIFRSPNTCMARMAGVCN